VNGVRRGRFVVCVRNKGFEHSLQLRRVYRQLPEAAGDLGWWRIIDDEGEDYLYPPDFFIPIALPPATARTLSALKD
jgi:hypothetical protein